jgi:hypothetical protein
MSERTHVWTFRMTNRIRQRCLLRQEACVGPSTAKRRRKLYDNDHRTQVILLTASQDAVLQCAAQPTIHLHLHRSTGSQVASRSCHNARTPPQKDGRRMNIRMDGQTDQALKASMAQAAVSPDGHKCRQIDQTDGHKCRQIDQTHSRAGITNADRETKQTNKNADR